MTYVSDQLSALRTIFKRNWGWYLLGILALLIWRSCFTRDVLLINRYNQSVSVRIASHLCYPNVPAKSHRFSIFPYVFSGRTALITIYGVDGKLLKSQTVDLTRTQNWYDSLIIIDIKP